MLSGVGAYNRGMAIDPGAVLFALAVLIGVELWWRARSR
jgi:hypothetical protein